MILLLRFIVTESIIRPIISASALTVYYIYMHYRKLQLLINVIMMTNTNVLLPQT